MKILVWHSPRVGSNLFMNMLHQTGVCGVKDYEQCGFPLGSIGVTTAENLQEKLSAYEQKQTTDNGVFCCKLSWEGLFNLANQIGDIEPIYKWLETIDYHIYMYRHDIIAQSVSMFIASKRAYFSTMKTEDILPTPEYSYNEIAYRRMRIERYQAEMLTYFEDYCISPYRISYEAFTYNEASIQSTVSDVLTRLGLQCDTIDQIKPQIRKQINPAKETYKDRFLMDYADRMERVR